MKLINNRWVDDNNNSWSAELETEESAIAKSKTLIDCSYCKGCSYCIGCNVCSDCSYCRGCIDCRNCSYCRDCKGCRCCSDCSDCSYCSYCRGFNSNPQRITSPKIGSRNSQTTFYWTDNHNQVVCGCFTGTWDDFKLKVDKTHVDNKYGRQYKKWIQAVEFYKNSL